MSTQDIIDYTNALDVAKAMRDIAGRIKSIPASDDINKAKELDNIRGTGHHYLSLTLAERLKLSEDRILALTKQVTQLTSLTLSLAEQIKDSTSSKTESRINLDKYLNQFPPEKITAYACPHCGSEIGCIIPETGFLTSMAGCPDCGGLVFRSVSSKGNVKLSFEE